MFNQPAPAAPAAVAQQAQQPAAQAQGFFGAQQQQEQEQTPLSQPFLGTFGQQPQQAQPFLGARSQQPPPPPQQQQQPPPPPQQQQQQPQAAWGFSGPGTAGLPSAGAPAQPNGYMEVDTQPPQWQYRFPAIDAGLVLYLCSRCKVRTHARFAKNWREVKMPRTGELLYSPGMLICGNCAEFNVNLRRHVDASS